MPTTTTFARRRNAVALVSGLATALIGLAVLAGYATRTAWLVTPIAGSAPMRPITAAALLCCGAAVLLLGTGFLRAAAAAAVLCGLGGAAKLFEALAGVHIAGLDPAFAAPADPRAGVLAACLLLLAAAALFLMSGVVRPRSRLALVGFSGSVLHSVGVVAVFSYLAGVSSAFSGGAFSELAIHTAAAMAALGAALIRFAWRDSVTAAAGAPAWLPLLVGAGALATTFCLYGAIKADHESDFGHQVAFEAEGLRQFLHAGLDNRIQPLIRMARHRAVAADLKRDEWDADAQMILTRGGYQAIEWIDASGRLVWATPPGAGDATPDGNAAFEPRRRAAFEAARLRREVAATRPVDLATGGKGMIVFVPVFARGELAGCVAGVFRYQLLFQNLLSSNPSPRYAIAVRDGSERVFAQGAPGGSPAQTRAMDLAVGGVSWKLEIGPTEALALQARTPAGEILLVGGGFFAVVLTLLTHLLRRSATHQFADAAAPGAAVSFTDGLPVVSYHRGGEAMAWNESAKLLFGGAPPAIPACAASFRTLHLTLLRASASPGSLDALRLLLDSCAQPALVFDPEGRFMAANMAAGGMLAWTDATWGGRSLGGGAGREPLQIQNVLLMQGEWAAPAAASARAAAAL